MDSYQPPEWHDPLFDKPQPTSDPNGGKLAKAAVALGVCSLLVVCVSGLSAAVGALAIVCGILSLKRCEDGAPLAKAGILLGIITIAVALILLCIYGMKYALAGVAYSISSLPYLDEYSQS